MVPHLTRCHSKHYTLQGMKKINVKFTLPSDFVKLKNCNNEKIKKNQSIHTKAPIAQ